VDRARQAVAEAGVSNLELREAGAEQLPIADEAIDVAMVNGIFNLNPARDAIFRELARVVRRGGTVFGAELILSSPLPQKPASVKRIGSRELRVRRKELPSCASSGTPDSRTRSSSGRAGTPEPRTRMCLQRKSAR